MGIHNQHVFISHYSGDVQKLRDLKMKLASYGCIVNNSSLEEDRDNKAIHKGKIVSDAVIARFLRSGIQWAKTVIILLGEHTAERPWVNYEIRNAHLKGKQIIGIYLHGCKDKVELPEAFKRYGGPTLGWGSIDKLSDILQGKVEFPCETPRGEVRGPIYNIVHIKC